MKESSQNYSLSKGWKIIQPSTNAEWEAYIRLRYEVLRKPWNQDINTTKDELEDKSVHFLILNELDESVATGRLQVNSETEAQIRSMAVHEKYRGRDIGNYLIQHLEKEAIIRGIKRIVLDAREPALNFYLKNNYKVVADSYLLFGIIKHFSMLKELQ